MIITYCFRLYPNALYSINRAIAMFMKIHSCLASAQRNTL